MDENNNFLDKNTLLAIGLSVFVFMGWQYYVQKKYPEAYKDKKPKVEAVAVETSQKSLEKPVENKKMAKSQEQLVVGAVEQQEKVTVFENQNFRGEISSQGMGLKQVYLTHYSDRNNKSIEFSNKELNFGNFATLVKEKAVPFKITKESENRFVGLGFWQGLSIQKIMEFEPESYTIKIQMNVSGTANFSEPLTTLLSNQVIQVETSFLTPAYEGTEFFTMSDGDEERERIDRETPMKARYEKANLTSIGSQYFAVALKDQSDLIPNVSVEFKKQDQVAYASVHHEIKKSGPTEIQLLGFMGPKKYDILKALPAGFVEMINYGIFSVLSKPILSLLKWLYSLFQNWGLAIILLTVFIRLLLLPINISSLKSMKKMQKIQPQLKAIKEKYKEDPARVNQETMALMKKEKANPLGGCLPMLLQLPVFFALYSVLGQSVELYKSPFIFWIQDLSYKDPFFVLPVAVGALYFIQMNLTPQTGMDPAQAKVMKFIPILFCFFMITVPSGLTLYFFVNTVFGIGQQFIFQREKRKAAA